MANTSAMEVTREVRYILTALLIVFVVLKLTGLVAWSWVWVLAPFWIPAIFAIPPIVVAAILVLMGKGFTKS